jgi:formate-dependent nitrite reductase cytochrome c552 subunit
MRTAGGKVVRYSPGGDAKPPAGAVWRTMDCVDCHNRPSHTFYLPEREVDTALLANRIPRDLPYVRREAVRLLKGGYPSQTAASRAITAGLESFYAKEHPQVAAGRRGEIAHAGEVLGAIYSANVFPSMKIGWGTYPNHIGHESSPGCFRCHDDQHATADGKRTISQDCSTCHSLLAMQEENPEILQSLQP